MKANYTPTTGGSSMQTLNQSQSTNNSAERDAAAQISVSELDIAFRHIRRLKAEGIKTVGDLMKMTRRELFRIPMIGKLAFRDIEEALALLGLTMKDDPDYPPIPSTEQRQPLLTPENALTKASAILHGCRSENATTDYPLAAGRLAMLLALITSSIKDDREWAKKEVRELVKLGSQQK